MDKNDKYTQAINKAHPINTGDHETYREAMLLVGNRHSKGALIDLVNYLLRQIKQNPIDSKSKLLDEMTKDC